MSPSRFISRSPEPLAGHQRGTGLGSSGGMTHGHNGYRHSRVRSARLRPPPNVRAAAIGGTPTSGGRPRPFRSVTMMPGLESHDRNPIASLAVDGMTTDEDSDDSDRAVVIPPFFDQQDEEEVRRVLSRHGINSVSASSTSNRPVRPRPLNDSQIARSLLSAASAWESEWSNPTYETGPGRGGVGMVIEPGANAESGMRTTYNADADGDADTERSSSEDRRDGPSASASASNNANRTRETEELARLMMESVDADADGEPDLDEEDGMEIDELVELECTPERSTSPSREDGQSSTSPIDLRRTSNSRTATTSNVRSTAPTPERTTPHSPQQSRHAEREREREREIERASERDRRTVDTDIAGICYDPKGQYIYVATSNGVFEWKLKDSEKRWWSSGALA